MPELQNARIYDEVNKTEMSLEKYLQRFMELANKQQDAMLNEAEQKKGDPSFVGEFEKKKEYIERYMVERMAATISAEVLQHVMEEQYEDINAAPGQAITGSYIGFFMEKNWFAANAGASPLADIQDKIEMEIKSHEENVPLQVAQVMVYSQDPLLDGTSMAKAAIIAYKMALKMNNFISISSRRDQQVGTRRRQHYTEITLFMILKLRKLWEILEEEIKTGVKGSVQLEISKRWDKGKAQYNVRMDMNKVNGVYKWAELYLYQRDLLKEIRGGDNNLRKNFFYIMHELKQNWTAQGFTDSPEFHFSITP